MLGWFALRAKLDTAGPTETNKGAGIRNRIWDSSRPAQQRFINDRDLRFNFDADREES